MGTQFESYDRKRESKKKRRGVGKEKKKVQKNGETVRVTSDFVYVNDSLFFFFLLLAT